MLARRFYKGTESHSWNLVSGSPASIYITHDHTSNVSHEAHANVAYDSYLAYCTRLGIPPQPFSIWCRLTDKMSLPGSPSASISTPEDVQMHEAFHQYNPVTGDRLEVQERLTARDRNLPTDEYGMGRRRVRPLGRAR